MLTTRRAFLLATSSAFVVACGSRRVPPSTPSTWTSSPHDVFQRLLTAIGAHDLETYGDCFAPETRASEGMVDRLAADPEVWLELDGLFRGPQELVLVDEVPERPTVGARVKGNVKAPEADGGGIGAMSFVLTEQGWRVYSW